MTNTDDRDQDGLDGLRAILDGLNADLIATRERVELLRRLVVDDPWSYSWEGLDDCCAFCGSGAQEYGTGIVGVKYRHEVHCAWIKAMDYLGREHPQHGFVGANPTGKADR